ncbi:SDR family NAD(P)-dependent oxidoreductase [Aspergillus mulundensis]|uniref:Short chain dehydrogenase n=1 Tax=Aspergillus mulundensis TaxID=1810919 RepID=A0A3D8T609_9EURO|nr:Short chain dehydrogenase [Aspergillus mulundensis]RDW93960.1 Short chain dehydrogenase [Aspergillus mulundensis]
MATAPALYPSLANKTVVITGGAEGIGAATVELFALQGSKVIFLDIADDAAQTTIARVVSRTEEAAARGGPAITPPIFYHCDVSNLPTLQETASRILSEHGPVHVLINNAAATGSAARMDTAGVTAESWETNINTNLRHVFFLTQAVLPGMKEAGSGAIVNLGSISWRIPAAGQPVYAACKAAIMGLTRVQSKEVGGAGIRINSVMPGAIATERQRREVLTEEYREEVMRGQSLKRDLVPMDVARVVVFLASEEAGAITGSSVVVDGGWVSDP